MSTNQESIDWYNQNAENYAAHVRNSDESIYHSLYEKPAMYGLLPNLEGKAVLSLGCGSGEDSRYLKEHGAASSVGVDISEGMIHIAQQNPGGCEFSVMDMEKLDFPDETFDFVYSSLAIHYIEDWTQVMRQAFRVLKPGGELLFSCNHPVNNIAFERVEDDAEHYLRELAKYKNKVTGEVKIYGDYVARKVVHGDKKLAVTTWTKSFGEISSEVTQAGFVIVSIVEPKPDPKMKDVSPADYETLTKIPDFVIFKLQKPM